MAKLLLVVFCSFCIASQAQAQTRRAMRLMQKGSASACANGSCSVAQAPVQVYYPQPSAPIAPAPVVQAPVYAPPVQAAPAAAPAYAYSPTLGQAQYASSPQWTIITLPVGATPPPGAISIGPPHNNPGG